MQVILADKPSEITSYKLIIFDLDGTLYDQRSLRIKVMFALISRLITFRMKLGELKTLSIFRKQRELHKGFASPDIENLQYQWCVTLSGKNEAEIRSIVENYMYTLPLGLIRKSIYPGVHQLMNLLKERGYITAVYSDYPAMAKLQALGIHPDAHLSATDPEVLELKPGKQAIENLCSRFNCTPDSTLLIGDRDDTDGESARQCGINFLKVDVPLARNGLFYSTLINQLEQKK